MVTSELNQPHTNLRGSVRAALIATTALWLITALASLAGAIAPRLASAQAPHPIIHPSVAAWGSILVTNARILCAPLALAALKLHRHRWGRRVGDLVVLMLLLVNGGLVGIELGRWGTRLLPYLPHLPLEWLAAGTSTSAWITARHNTARSIDRLALARTAIATCVLLAAAAAVEVVLTPHAGGGA